MSAVDCVNSEDPLFKHQNALALSGGEKKKKEERGDFRLSKTNKHQQHDFKRESTQPVTYKVYMRKPKAYKHVCSLSDSKNVADLSLTLIP